MVNDKVRIGSNFTSSKISIKLKSSTEEESNEKIRNQANRRTSGRCNHKLGNDF